MPFSSPPHDSADAPLTGSTDPLEARRRKHAHPPLQRRAYTAVMDRDAVSSDGVRLPQGASAASAAACPAAAIAPASQSPAVVDTVTWSVDAHVAEIQDDDIVLDTPASLLPCMATAAAAAAAAVAAPESSPHAHPAARGVGQDVIDLVTDAFTAQREAAVKRRREVLYELTHPNPADYTYDGKLVPPPPLSFGQVTEEARSLGNKMMLGQSYALVRQAGTRASDDDTLGHGSASSARGNTAGAAAAATAPASYLETSVAAPSSAFSARRLRDTVTPTAPYRGRARESNIFRDHNYFFEINELYQEVVFVGRACAGKSSLLNALLGQHVAKTSSTPNTTRKISFYQSVTPEQLQAFHAREHHNQLVKLPGGGLQLTFVDLPGYGIPGMSDKWRDAAIELTDAYFGVRRSVNTVLYCMDCERGLTKTDVKYFEWIENVHGTCFIVLTKCDTVPHSRVCSVMRQVYSLITKHRRKYRKVFPFIIPVSAKDGTNIEMLRGMIAETSGMIPGDKLRDLLQRKKASLTQTALLQEAGRIDAARRLERAQAREYFAITRGETNTTTKAVAERPVSISAAQVDGDGATLSADPSSSSAPGVVDREATQQGYHRRYVLPLDQASAGGVPASLVDPAMHTRTPTTAADVDEFFPTESSAAAAAAKARRERRERFLAWRRAHPLASALPWYSTAETAAGVGGTASAEPDSSAGTGSGRTGGARYRLNTGLENPQSAQAVLELMSGDTAQGPASGDAAGSHAGAQLDAGSPREELDTASSSGVPAASVLFHGQRSSVIGLDGAGGPVRSPSSSDAVPGARADQPSGPAPASPAPLGAVSRFLDVVEQYGAQRNNRGRPASAKQWRKEEQWRHRGADKGGGASRGSAAASALSAAAAPHGSLLAEDACGRLSPYTAGRPSGPALVSLHTRVDSRQAAWRAQQLKTLLSKENPEAPWTALHRLRRKVQSAEEAAALSGMRKKETAAYVRDAGRVTESFEKFEGEVAAAKYMNEVRQAPTLRSQQQMHLNATAKINYRSMPPGLWKRYGEKETYWPTSSVLGRASDESHK